MVANRESNSSFDFETGAVEVIRSLRGALSAVVANIPQFTYSRPNDLAARLGLDPKLAWNVGRCLESPDLFASARFIPGPTGMRTLLRAARQHEAPPQLIDQVRNSFEDFCNLVQRHAGSRKHFNMLAAGLALTDNIKSDIEHRRMLFDGNTYFWGVHARTIFRTYIAKPSDNVNTYDLTTVRGIIDFARVRPNVTWRITLPSTTDDDEKTHSNVDNTALDSNATGPVPLLTDYCTRPLPKFRPRLDATSGREFDFVEDSIGNSTRMTCVTGELIRNIEPRYRQALYHDFCVSYVIRTPARNLVCDLLIHRDLFPDNDPPALELYGDLFNYGFTIRYDPNDRMPLHETLEQLGSGAEVAFTPEIPRYPEMLNYAMNQVGWNGGEFNLYRLKMQYPPIHTTLMLRKPLPEQE